MHQYMVKHLELIQATITRMASNSFLLKSWAITLAAAGFALAAQETTPWFILLAALVATLSFWGLDAYYLRQERLFRRLYDAVRTTSQDEWEKSGRFSMSTHEYSKLVESWFFTLFASTIVPLYGVIAIGIITGAIILLRHN